jgi:hypothetical protein
MQLSAMRDMTREARRKLRIICGPLRFLRFTFSGQEFARTIAVRLIA